MSLSKARQLAQDLGTVGISSGGTSVATTVANINFVGAGNTFAVNGTTVDIRLKVVVEPKQVRQSTIQVEPSHHSF